MKTLILLVSIFLTKQCLCDEIIEVSLKQGVVLGKIETSIYKKQNYFAFKGIPFAETPTGELRFQPPKPHGGWDGDLEAFDNKPTCMQFSSRMRLGEPFGISGSEDCLYISVFTPDVKGNAPVIVFDYNDQFRTWFNGTNTYSPDFLVEEGVIVVTISHRLAILGYLTTEDGVIKANNGLRDFILGLEWVKNNIAQFGGDPSKVTLMGSKSGAVLADMLLYSEKAKGLFSGAILQSGSSLEALYFYDNPKQKAFELGAALNITAADSHELLKELQKIDVEKILLAEIDTLDRKQFEEYHINSFPFAPTIEKNTEDAVLTRLPENGKIVNDVPIIIGFNSREGLDFMSHLIFEPRFITESAEEDALHLPIRTNFRFDRRSSKYKAATQDILNYYLEDKILHYGNILEYTEYIGDVLLNYPMDLTARKLAGSLSSPVFYYNFDYRGQWNENSQYLSTRARFSIVHKGATVGDELCYLLVCSRIKKSYNQVLNLASEQNEVKVARKIVRMWSNFAKTGNPTPTKDDAVLKGFTWEPIGEEPDINYLHITKLLRMKTNPLGDRKKFWDDFLEKYSNMAVDGVLTDDPNSDEPIEENSSPDKLSRDETKQGAVKEDELNLDEEIEEEFGSGEDEASEVSQNKERPSSIIFVESDEDIILDEQSQYESSRDEL